MSVCLCVSVVHSDLALSSDDDYDEDNNSNNDNVSPQQPQQHQQQDNCSVQVRVQLPVHSKVCLSGQSVGLAFLKLSLIIIQTTLCLSRSTRHRLHGTKLSAFRLGLYSSSPDFRLVLNPVPLCCRNGEKGKKGKGMRRGGRRG